MSFLFRKVTRSKWGLDTFFETKSADDIPADGLTCCIQTKSNTLSVWKSNKQGWEENEDLLATLFSSADGPSKSHVVVLNEEKLLESGVSIEATLGQSPAVESVNEKHRDLTQLNYKDIGTVAYEMASIMAVYEELDEKSVDEFLDYKVFTEGEVKAIVRKGIDNGHIDVGKIPERWKRKLKL